MQFGAMEISLNTEMLCRKFIKISQSLIILCDLLVHLVMFRFYP